MSEVKIPAKDGGEFKAYIALPDKTPSGAVILIQEIFGVNKEMRDKCDLISDQGYIAICPDLFWRIEPGIQLVDSDPEQLKRAFELFGLFDIDKGLEDLSAALDFIRGHKDCNGQVACIGYCLGGKLAYMMAARSSVDAAVGYYGVGIETMLKEAENIKKPLLLHIAGSDEFVPPEAQKKIEETLLEHPTAQTFHYPGMQHAFARFHGMHYNEDAAKLADKRTAEFLRENLRRAEAA